MFTKKNKVLFIIHDVFQEDNQFLLGPAYLAAVLNEQGAGVEAFCMDVFHYTNKQLVEHLTKNKYDIIGLGFSAARFEETVRELCTVINQNKKDAWFVLGGPGPSPIPEYILRETGADIVAIGEAENTIIDLLKCKINNENLSDVDGIAYLENNKFKRTAPNKAVINLDTIPYPLWEIFPMDKYIGSVIYAGQEPHEKSFQFITSRGCVNRCNFCYRMEKGIRLRSIKNIIEELKILWNKYGVNCYFFQDELFVVNKNRLLEFETSLKEANLKIKFSCNARVDILDEEMVEILKRCGCHLINIGFESSDNEVLKLMNKNTTVEQNINVFKMINEAAGIGMGINIIWNNLADNQEILKKNVELIKKYNTYYQRRTIRPVTPFPGSDLYYKAIEMGKLKGPDDFFNKFKNSDLITVNFMDNISDEEAHWFLLDANTELIIDHHMHTDKNMESALELIQQFVNLYSGKITKFRGARHYSKSK